MVSLSQRRSRVVFPCPRPRINQAVSMALMNPRPIPVPVGQNGYYIGAWLVRENVFS